MNGSFPVDDPVGGSRFTRTLAAARERASAAGLAAEEIDGLVTTCALPGRRLPVGDRAVLPRADAAQARRQRRSRVAAAPVGRDTGRWVKSADTTVIQ